MRRRTGRGPPVPKLVIDCELRRKIEAIGAPPFTAELDLLAPLAIGLHEAITLVRSFLRLFGDEIEQPRADGASEAHVGKNSFAGDVHEQQLVRPRRNR